MTNPYASPDENDRGERVSRRPIYAYVVAACGAILVFGGALLAVMLLPLTVYPAIYKTIFGLIAMYVIGVPVALLASAISFRATLRAYSRP
jgi:hypothetical protein